MTVEKLSECKGDSRFRSCTECKTSESDTYNMYRLKFKDVVICLCQDCFSKVRQELNNTVLIW